MDTFRAEADGVYSLEINYENKNIAYPYVTVMTGTEQPEDITVSEDTTAVPTGTTLSPVTEAPVTEAPITEAPATDNGCGGYVTLGVITCIIPAAVVVCKKRD